MLQVTRIIWIWRPTKGDRWALVYGIANNRVRERREAKSQTLQEIRWRSI